MAESARIRPPEGRRRQQGACSGSASQPPWRCRRSVRGQRRDPSLSHPSACRPTARMVLGAPLGFQERGAQALELLGVQVALALALGVALEVAAGVRGRIAEAPGLREVEHHADQGEQASHRPDDDALSSPTKGKATRCGGLWVVAGCGRQSRAQGEERGHRTLCMRGDRVLGLAA
jgi:hypothetical protein